MVLNAVDAAERGAVIRTRTRCVRAERGDSWRLVLMARGQRDVITAGILVNAAGAWSEIFAETALREVPRHRLHLDKGSHIVVRRLYQHDRAYILQAADGRVVFAIPFERDFTLIGTTDRTFAGDPSTATPSGEEIDYLCRATNEYFRTEIGAADVVWAFAGVRSLYDDGAHKAQDVGRDYELILDKRYGEAPLLTVYGGKLTTYRRLAEDALDRLTHILPARPAWTSGARLPGGDIAVDGVERLISETRQSWPFLSERHARRLVGAYGTRAARILGSAKSLDDLGPLLGADLTGAEAAYLMTHEWAQTADDVLWRRSKLGLKFSREERARVAKFMSDGVGNPAREPAPAGYR